MFHYTVRCTELLHFEPNGAYPITQKNFTWNMFIFNLYHIHFRTLFMRFLSMIFFHTEWLLMSSIQYRVVTAEKLIPTSVLGALDLSTLIRHFEPLGSKCKISVHLTVYIIKQWITFLRHWTLFWCLLGSFWWKIALLVFSKDCVVSLEFRKYKH